MDKKEMQKKLECFEEMLTDMRHAIQDELMLKRERENEVVYEDDYTPSSQEDREKDYIGNDRRNLGCTVPYWILDYYFEVLIPKFEGRIKPYHRKDLTPADIVRHLLYAAMLNPESVPLSTYDDIKHLKE